ncbi:CdvA-like protein [Candidatus Bathyarchaeota archaeon]|nr:CdvA-like protein [Candidatus Bathyarchaeota archaeon]
MLSSWKTSFEKIRSELELAKRKKQTLDELLAKNRMSRPTYEHLVGSLNENISEFESHKKTLQQKMNERAEELKSQAELLKLFLATLEMKNIAKEVKSETYEKNKQVFELGLEATENELAEINNALTKIS